YTDGSVTSQGTTEPQAGSGVWFDPNDKRNLALKLPTHLSTNNAGELVAILAAASQLDTSKNVIMKSDSHCAINRITKHLQQWEDLGWIGIKIKSILKHP
ncbi:hypothetical protein M378DRAFT_93442, partial [Amanita muscaria Koide BX008]